MKFAEHLSAHITPEWHNQYIRYDELKKLLIHRLEKSPGNENPAAQSTYMDKFERDFFEILTQESQKVNSFFTEKLAESTRRTLELKNELTYLISPSESYGRDSPVPEVQIPRKKLEKLKHGLILAFSEAYLALILLQNFQELNYQGFRKLLKKHDKLWCTENGRRWFRKRIDPLPFHKDNSVDGLIHQVENLVATHLLDGDMHKAMKKLRVPPLSTNTAPTFLLGFLVGVLLVFILAIFTTISDNPDDYDWETITRLYRGPFFLNLFIFFIGLNIYGWRAHGVNHILIFEIDPRNHLSAQNILEVAFFLHCVCAGSILVFLRSEDLGIGTYTSPMALLVFYLVFLFNPTNTFWRSGRAWVIRKMLRVITAPFHKVGFADFWLADQLTSLTQCILDVQYLICIYIWADECLYGGVEGEEQKECNCGHPSNYIRPVLRCLPAWFRFLQCLRRYYDSREKFPHLYNATKYGCSFFVVIFSNVYRNVSETDHDSGLARTFVGLWICAGIVSSCYSYFWDIRMDWGLFDQNVKENKFLREEIVYNKVYYYLAIVEDLILRFSWAVQLSLTEMGGMTSELVTTCLAPAELIRRFIWNFFRLENEHLNNCGNFRAVRDISIVPVLKSFHEDDKSNLSFPTSPSSPALDSNSNFVVRFTFPDKNE